jgi:F-type H+-transporting ATPase subunit c
MRKAVTTALLLLAVLVVAPPAFAQAQPEGGAASVMQWLAIASAFGMGLAAAGCGYAQSRVAGAACEGMARNPGAADPIRAAMFLGLVFIETLALFTLVIIFTMIFRFA